MDEALTEEAVMAKKGYSRRNYFIDKQFQGKFIMKFCALVVVSSLLIAALIFVLSQNSTTVAIENTKVQVKTTSDFILPVLIQTVIIVSIFTALAVIILTLFISHQISGPLFRLKREIDKLKDGDLGRNFNIRSSDQLQALSKSLNDMCISLRQKYVDVKDRCLELKEFLEDKKVTLSVDDRRKATKILKEIDSALKNFKI
jgi:methyl-accepting chemotaxis protein